MRKLLTIYFDGAILAKFSTPPSGKTMDWTQKSIGPKMMARTTSITMQNLVEINFKVRQFLTLNISKMAADTAIVTMEGE